MSQTVAAGAAHAVKKTMEPHKIPGTIVISIGPAEEQLMSRPYLVRDGYFKNVDAACCAASIPGPSRASSGRSSRPRDRRQAKPPGAPKRATRSVSGNAATAPSVRSPSRTSSVSPSRSLLSPVRRVS